MSEFPVPSSGCSAQFAVWTTSAVRRYSALLRVVHVVVALCFLGAPSPAAEPDLRPELEVAGRIDSIEVSPLGDLWFGTLMGRVYRSRNWNESWEEVPVPVRQSKGFSTDNDLISQVRFFDSVHGLMSGYIGEPTNLVYRTVDGGKTWVAVTLPSSLWVYDAQTSPEGLGWLVGSDGGLLFTEDFGATWSALNPPYDQEARSHSVHFTSRTEGVVASLHGGIKWTRNGGRSWKKIKTPSEIGLKTCEDARIETARLFRGTLLINQCGELFTRTLLGQTSWKMLRAGDRPLLAYELFGDGLVAVASGFEIVKIGPDLKTIDPTGAHLEAFPIDIAAGSGKAVFLDATYKVSVLDAEGVRSSRMLGEGKAAVWPVFRMDRSQDGTFWGISDYFLYHSADVGATWERQVESPRNLDAVAIQRSGEIMMWSRHGYSARWSPGKSRMETIPELDGLDIVGLFRRGDLWLAYGGMQHETTRRIEVARTYFSGQFAGSADFGFVAVSTDGGSHWKVVDRWKDGGVQQIFLGEDNTLTLLSWLCAVRRGRLVLDGASGPTAQMETILPATNETRDKVPYVEHARLLDFTGGEIGWVKGWTHHLGDSVFHTTDGGRTWLKADASVSAADALYRLGGGGWLAFVAPVTIQVRRDGRFESLKTFDIKIDSLILDSTGSLVLKLENGELWLLPSSPGDWTRLNK
jgi:photosystem II stability/assembly factor-like uncharacterized protein